MALLFEFKKQIKQLQKNQLLYRYVSKRLSKSRRQASKSKSTSHKKRFQL
jgi:hypothetical protein